MIRQVVYHFATIVRQLVTIFCYFISPRDSSIGWTVALDLRMIRSVLYHCDTTITQFDKILLMDERCITSQLVASSI